MRPKYILYQEGTAIGIWHNYRRRTVCVGGPTTRRATYLAVVVGRIIQQMRSTPFRFAGVYLIGGNRQRVEYKMTRRDLADLTEFIRRNHSDELRLIGPVRRFGRLCY